MIRDIHHISAIVGHPQESLDFYTQVLGLRLVKQTVNFDQPDHYHLYFGFQGDAIEEVMTFFHWTDPQSKGVVGSGQVGRIGFRIPQGRMEEWQDHLSQHGVEHETSDLFGQRTLEFSDGHDLALALVEGEQAAADKAILGFHGTVLLSKFPDQSADHLENFLGLELLDQTDQAFHLQTQGVKKHRIVVIKDPLPVRRLGQGTVHHVAWAVDHASDLEAVQEALDQANKKHSGVKDRKYFHSLYYREPGKIVFEIASRGPGFTVDEEADQLGQNLQLPDIYEHLRPELKEILPVLEF